MWTLKLLLTTSTSVLPSPPLTSPAPYSPPANIYGVDEYSDFYKSGSLICAQLNDNDNKKMSGCCSNNGRRSLTLSHRSRNIHGCVGTPPVILFVPGGGNGSHSGIGRLSLIISEFGDEYDIVTLIYRIPCVGLASVETVEDTRNAITRVRKNYNKVFALGGSKGSGVITLINGIGPIRTDAQVLMVLPVKYQTQYGAINTTSNQTPPTYFAYGGRDGVTPNVSHYNLFDARLAANNVCHESQYVPMGTHSTTWNLINYTHIRQWLAPFVNCLNSSNTDCCSMSSPISFDDMSSGEPASGSNVISDEPNVYSNSSVPIVDQITASPSTPPLTPSPACMQCTDKAPQWMVNNGQTCSGYRNPSCSKSSYWVNNRFCELTCQQGSNPYDPGCCLSPPSPPPFPAPSLYTELACVQCIDRPSPYMVRRGRSCESFANFISRQRCNKQVWWVNERYCELTCEANGAGYNKPCCHQTSLPMPSPPPRPPIPPLSPPVPPIPPTPLTPPALSPPSPCVICTDTPTAYMRSRGKSCASWAKFISNHRCNADREWLAKHYCEFTCEANGVGYWASIHWGCVLLI